jgi:hypothetical protein
MKRRGRKPLAVPRTFAEVQGLVQRKNRIAAELAEKDPRERLLRRLDALCNRILKSDIEDCELAIAVLDAYYMKLAASRRDRRVEIAARLAGEGRIPRKLAAQLLQTSVSAIGRHTARKNRLRRK